MEPIDLAAVGVLSMAMRVTNQLEYFTVAQSDRAVIFQNGLKVLPDHSFGTAPAADVIIVYDRRRPLVLMFCPRIDFA